MLNREKNVIYIAGRMRGLPDMGRESFAKAERKLKEMGWRPINPGILPVDLPEESYMPICLAMLQQADAVCLLDGWRYSEGARLEYQYARMTGKETILETNIERYVSCVDDTPIETLNLSARSRNALLRGGVKTIGKLKQTIVAEPKTWYYGFHAMGKKIASEIEWALRDSENR